MKWKPSFRRFGNRHSGDLGTAAPQGHAPVAEQRSQSNHSLRLLSGSVNRSLIVPYHGLSIEACIFLGLLVLFLSIKHSKTIGILIGCCFAILDFVIYYILEDYPSVFFFSPISWVDISCLTGNIYPTIRYAILSVSVLIIALIWFCIRLIKSRDELPVI